MEADLPGHTPVITYQSCLARQMRAAELPGKCGVWDSQCRDAVVGQDGGCESAHNVAVKLRAALPSKGAYSW